MATSSRRFSTMKILPLFICDFGAIGIVYSTSPASKSAMKSRTIPIAQNRSGLCILPRRIKKVLKERLFAARAERTEPVSEYLGRTKEL